MKVFVAGPLCEDISGSDPDSTDTLVCVPEIRHHTARKFIGITKRSAPTASIGFSEHASRSKIRSVL
jgi:hypothetical protein